MNRDSDKVYTLRLSPFQRRLMINGLNEYLTVLSERGQPAEDICDLLTEVMNAPAQNEIKKRSGFFAGIRRR